MTGADAFGLAGALAGFLAGGFARSTSGGLFSFGAFTAGAGSSAASLFGFSALSVVGLASVKSVSARAVLLPERRKNMKARRMDTFETG